MPLLHSTILAFAFSCAIGSAAALVPVPGLRPSLPVAGLEPNGGQAQTEILFLSRGSSSLAVTAQSVLYSPLGVRLVFLASNPNPAVRFSDPLPGIMNSFTGGSSQKWVTGFSRYSTAHLGAIYPGIDAQYVMGADGQLTLQLLLSVDIDPQPVGLEIPKAVAIGLNPEGALAARSGPSRFDPQLVYAPPVAFQDGASGRGSRSARYSVQSATRFGLEIEGLDRTLPLRIEMKLGESASVPGTGPSPIVDGGGNTHWFRVCSRTQRKCRFQAGHSWPLSTPGPRQVWWRELLKSTSSCRM
jgi:hypothetical protein